jgi:hypothetical protein
VSPLLSWLRSAHMLAFAESHSSSGLGTRSSRSRSGVIEARVPSAGRSAHITSGPPRTHPCNLWAQPLRDDQSGRTVQATWTSYSGSFRFVCLRRSATSGWRGAMGFGRRRRVTAKDDCHASGAVWVAARPRTVTFTRVCASGLSCDANVNEPLQTCSLGLLIREWLGTGGILLVGVRMLASDHARARISSTGSAAVWP